MHTNLEAAPTAPTAPTGAAVRPDLATTSVDAGTSTDSGAEAGERSAAVAPPETPAEITAPIPKVPANTANTANPASPASPVEPAAPGRSAPRNNEVPMAAQPAAVEPLAPMHTRVLDWLVLVVGKGPQSWSQRPLSLKEMLEYSRSGDWTTKPPITATTDLTTGSGGTSARRNLHLFYVAVVLLPIAVIASTVLWAVQRPGRLLVTVLAVLSVGTLLDCVADQAVADALTFQGLTAALWPF